MRGDFEPALAAYAMLADRQESLAAGLAWRYGLVHYLRGEPHSALEVFQRGVLDAHPVHRQRPTARLDGRGPVDQQKRRGVPGQRRTGPRGGDSDRW